LYTDVDVVNCHPTILTQMCRRAGVECPLLLEYVGQRDRVIAEIGGAWEQAKMRVVMAMFDDDVATDGGWLTRFSIEMGQIKDAFAAKNKKLLADVTAHRGEKNAKASMLSHLMAREERRVMVAARRVLQAAGVPSERMVDAFDGVMVPVDCLSIDDDCLARMSDAVLKETSWRVQFAIKPMADVITAKIGEAPALANDADGEFDLEAIKYNTCYEVLRHAFNSQWTQIVTPPAFVNVSQDGKMTLKCVKDMRESFMMLNVPGEKGKAASFIDLYLRDADRPSKDRMDFLPPPCECPGNVLNKFRGFAAERIKATGGTATPFLAHLNVMVDGDLTGYPYLVRYLAHMVQRPGEIAEHAIVFTSPTQGVGKGMLMKMLGLVIGERYLALVDKPDSQLFGQFIPDDVDKVLVHLDEYKRADHDSELKQRIGNGQVTYNIKFVNGGCTQRNFSRYIFTTNDVNTVKVDVTNRRFAIFRPSDAKVGDTEYFKGLDAYMRDPRNIRAIYDYLMGIELPERMDWSPDAIPKTAAYMEARVDNVPGVLGFFIHLAVQLNRDGRADDEYTNADFYELFKQFVAETCERDRGRTALTEPAFFRQLGALMTKHGAKLGVVNKSHIKRATRGSKGKLVVTSDLVAFLKKMRLYEKWME
jgi:hypothetical protein